MANSPTDRRRFLRFCTDALFAAIGLLLAVPVLGYMMAPLLRKRCGGSGAASFVKVGVVNELPVGEWRLMSLEVVNQDGWDKARRQYSVWVRRNDNSHPEVTVLSPICPHLGCHVDWYPALKEFVCPCHGGTYNSNGKYLAGPPPRSMDPLPHEIRDDQLWVRWEDFKIGVAQRVPVEV